MSNYQSDDKLSFGEKIAIRVEEIKMKYKNNKELDNEDIKILLVHSQFLISKNPFSSK